MISIKGIRIENMNLNRESDGRMKLTGQYGLVSTADTILAKQGFNGYSDLAYTLSPDTEKLLREFTTSVIADINKLIGME